MEETHAPAIRSSDLDLPPAGGRSCPNCGAPAEGRFCSACGQRQGRRLASIRGMLAAALADQFSLDATLPRTLGGLLRPGYLTREYLAGRIARYIPPLRLYLVSSLLFFFALSWTVAPGEAPSAGDAGTAASVAETGAEAEVGPARMNIQVDIVDRDTTGLSGWERAVVRTLVRRVDRLRGMTVAEFESRFLTGLQRNAPKAVFVLIPVFALCLKLLYLRRRRLYAEHFVFALHVHAFAFLLFTLMLLIPGGLDVLVLLLLLAAYLFSALHRVYRQSVPGTLLKYSLLVGGYGLALLAVLVVTAALTALTI